MSLLNNLRDGFMSAFDRNHAPSMSPTPMGGNIWQPMGGNTIPMHDTYDNVFPYVNAIAQRFSTVIPYAVDSENQRIDPDRKSTRLNSSHANESRMPSSA